MPWMSPTPMIMPTWLGDEPIKENYRGEKLVTAELVPMVEPQFDEQTNDWESHEGEEQVAVDESINETMEEPKLSQMLIG